MSPQPPESRIRSALFAPPAIEAQQQPATAEAVDEVAQPVEVAAPAQPVTATSTPRRARKPKQAKEATAALQVHLPVAVWQAFRIECLKRRVPAVTLVMRALVATLPSVATAARDKAA